MPAASVSGGLSPHRKFLLVLFVLITVGSFLVWSLFSRRANIETYVYEQVASYPHDATSFTQGLLWHNGHLYESTGHYGKSRIRKVELESGTPVIDKKLDDKHFGEGLALVKDRLIQLTWQKHIGIVYDLDLNKLDEFRLPGDEAWGLAYDGQELIMSDGSSTLRFLDPETYEVKREVTVHHGRTRVGYLNELEYVNGLLFANVWRTDDVMIISPEDGSVVGRLDLRELYPYQERKSREDVLNGIAYRPETNTFLVTGKHWPNVFELKISRP